MGCAKAIRSLDKGRREQPRPWRTLLKARAPRGGRDGMGSAEWQGSLALQRDLPSCAQCPPNLSEALRLRSLQANGTRQTARKKIYRTITGPKEGCRENETDCAGEGLGREGLL